MIEAIGLLFCAYCVLRALDLASTPSRPVYLRVASAVMIGAALVAGYAIVQRADSVATAAAGMEVAADTTAGFRAAAAAAAAPPSPPIDRGGPILIDTVGASPAPLQAPR
jgi:hypothetical protein